MHTFQEKYQKLIIKELEGDITEQERSALQQWLAQSDENRRFYEETRRLWEIAPVDPSKIVINKPLAWEKINNEIAEAEATEAATKVVPFRSRLNTLRVLSGIAAIFLLFIGLYILLPKSGSPNMITVENHDHTSADPLTLPDGSVVYFNGIASVQFPETFEGSHREVALDGNAFFEVQSHPEKPFVVNWEGTQITVLATSFDLHHNAMDNILRLAVITGKVKFLTPYGSSLQVNAGEMATLRLKTEVLEKSAIEDYNFLSWHTQKLEFNDAPIVKVFEDLKIAYPIDIVWDRDLPEYKLTARFVNEKPEDIFYTIGMLFDLTVEYNNGIWRISK